MNRRETVGQASCPWFATEPGEFTSEMPVPLRLLWVAALALICSSAQAEIRFYEGFDYPVGVLGENSPPWTRATNVISVVEGNLNYSNFAECIPAGRCAQIMAGSLPSAAASLGAFSSVITSGSVYFSFLIEVSATGTSLSYVAGMLPSSVPQPGGNSFDPCDLYVSPVSGGYQLGIRTKGGALSSCPSIFTLNTPCLVVLKYQFAAARASLYLNPAPGDSEPAAADAYSTGISAANLDHVYLRSSGSAGSIFKVDNLRVGTTWEEVTPAGNYGPATGLVFAASPLSGTESAPLSSVIVRIQNDDGFNVPSNNVVITLALNANTFAAGDTTATTDVYGKAVFNGLAIASPGTCQMVATASGPGTGLASASSAPLVIGSTNITTRGMALSSFLDSLEVERYWDNGKSVNWLTGAPGGSGVNMTKGTASHCSAFAAAAADLLGVYILRQPDTNDLNLANNQADWLASNSASGWFPIALAKDAQHIANSGELVMASLRESSGSGHIAVLRPSTKSDAAIQAEGPQECQSGINNYNDIDVKTGFSYHDNPLTRVLYYGHMITNPISPVNPIFLEGCHSNGVFCLPAISVVGRRYVLQYSPDFEDWTNLHSFTNSNEGADFYCVTPLTDSSGAGAPRRFYRLLSQ